ncbi:hypothetical protein KR52_11040 [Synechococcus sp. KORDI-52]|nr:hypothetical protein KR52_11040 [Synechococcus sp. KORDI-52]
MTAATGLRRNSARLKGLAKYLRTKHSDRFGLSLRRKTRPSGEELIYLTFNSRPDGSGDQKWLKLNASYQDGDVVISTAVDTALAEFDNNLKKNAGGPVGSSLGVYQRQALGRIESSGNSEKHASRRVKWLKSCVQWLSENNGRATSRDDLLRWIQSWPAEARSRRDAISAACLLFDIATDGKRLNPGRENGYQEPAAGQGKPVDPAEIERVILGLWKRSENSELAHACAWITSWVALTGARGAMVMASELLWKEPGQIEVAVGSYVRCRDSKRGRNRPANLCPSWRGLLESVGIERLQRPPVRLRKAASPWDDKPTLEQQRKTEQELGALHGWLWRELSDEKGLKADRELIGLRTLRHNAARRLLEVKQLDLLQIAGLLSTSEEMLRRTYADHHRFRSHEIIREVFG